ncbi:MAG: type II CAAX endopeptidase family protein [Bacteroidota bacterium]
MKIFKVIVIILLATLTAGLIYGFYRNFLFYIILDLPYENSWLLASVAQVFLVPSIYLVFKVWNKKINTLEIGAIGYYLDSRAFLGFIKGGAIATAFMLFTGVVYSFLSSAEIPWSNWSRLPSSTFIGSFFQNFGGAGSFEEFFTRGFIFIFLIHKCKLSSIQSILWTSLIFMSLHFISFEGDFVWIFETFVFAVFINLLFINYRNIWLVVGFHTIWNTFYQLGTIAKTDLDPVLINSIFIVLLFSSIVVFVLFNNKTVRQISFG